MIIYYILSVEEEIYRIVLLFMNITVYEVLSLLD